MTREGNRVYLDLSEDDFDNLLLVLGFAWAAARHAAGPINERFVLRLANAINEGNPNFTPYQLSEGE